MHSRIRLQLTVDNEFIRVNSKTEEKNFQILRRKTWKKEEETWKRKKKRTHLQQTVDYVSMKTKENIISTSKQFQ